MSSDKPTIDDLIADMIAESHRVGDDNPDQYWTAALKAFAAEIVNRVLPRDPVAHALILLKAEAFGIDLSEGGRPAPGAPANDG